MRGFAKSERWAFLVMLAAIVVAPFFIYPIFLMRVMAFALFAGAFNLLIGYVGLLSFGHAAYFGFGGYIGAYLAKSWGATPEVAVLAGGLAGGAIGTVFGWLAIRRQGIYFAMITLALGQMVYFFCVQAPFTGGEDGIQSIPRGRFLGLVPLASDRPMYVFTAAVFLVFFFFLHRIVHSPFGNVLKAVRDNEPRATSLGYRTDTYKWIAFILSAFVAGCAGALKDLVFGLATLSDVHWSMSGEIVLITLVGGMGTTYGPVVGALIVMTMETYLAPYGAWVTVIQGAIFIACVLTFRRGIVGELAAKLKIQL